MWPLPLTATSIQPIDRSETLSVATLNHDIPRAEVTAQIAKLIDNLVNIKDETGEFLLRLEDGRVIG